MARRRDDGSFQRILPLESGTEKAEKAGYALGVRGLISPCPYASCRPLLQAAWKRGYRNGLTVHARRMSQDEGARCRA